MENSDNNYVSPEYNNTQYAADLKAIGVNPDTLLNDYLTSDGYTIKIGNGQTIIQKYEELTNYEILDLGYSNGMVGDYSLKYDKESKLFYILSDSYKVPSGITSNYSRPSRVKEKVYITSENQEYINNFLNNVNKENTDYNVTVTFDEKTSMPIFEKVYTIPKEEYNVLSSVYNGDISLSSYRDKKHNVIYSYECNEEKFNSLFGSVENAKKMGINASIVDGKYVFEMPKNTSVEFKTQIDNQYNLVSSINNSSDEYYTFQMTTEEYEKFFHGAYCYHGVEGNGASHILSLYLNDDKKRTIDSLTQEEIKYLSSVGIYIVDGRLYDSSLFPVCDVEFSDDNNDFVNVSIPKDSQFIDEVLTILTGSTDYKNLVISSSKKAMENRLSNLFNANLSNQLCTDLKCSNLFMFPIDGEGAQTSFGNAVDYASNKYFGVVCNGYGYVIDNSNVNLSLEKNASLQIYSLVSKDEQNYNNLGFTLSYLINSELKSLPISNLKNNGYSDVYQCSDGSFKIYLDNGQYYLLEKEELYKLSQVVNDVEVSDAMRNLNIQNSILKNEEFKNSDVDVRATGDYYEIYIDGNLYSIEREKIDKYDENGNLLLSDEELYTSIFNQVKDMYNDDTRTKETTRNGFLPTSMFTPYIDLKNEEYYRKICTNLDKYSEDLLTYSSSISSNINIQHPFTNSTFKKEKYKNLVDDTAAECVKLSKKIEYCVNLVTQCDISLKDTLDSIIGDFFDEVNEEVFIENNTVKVDSQAYINYFSTKMEEYKEQIPIYNLLIMGKAEVPDEYAKKMMEMGLQLETATIDGNTFYVASKDTISYFVSKTNNVVFNDNYTVFDWISDNIPDELDDSNPEHRFLKNIGMLKLTNDDLQGVTRLRNSLDAFCNTEPYLKYICSDEYSDMLKKVRNGEFHSYWGGDGTWFREYYTDFQKTLLFMEFKEKEPIYLKEWEQKTNLKYEDIKNNDFYYGDAREYVVSKLLSGVNKIEDIVPYTYNEIAGYNEALKTLARWYEKDGITLDECLLYDLHKLGEGFFEYPANAFHLINPETSVNEYKSKYLTEMLSSITSTSEKDIYNMSQNGNITEFDKNLRLKMIDEIGGLNPDDVQASANVARTIGVIGSEALLYYLSGKMTNLPAVVKGLSMGGKVSKDVYSKGYSAEAARLAGLVSGTAMFLLHSKLNTKSGKSFNGNNFVDKFDIPLGKTGIKYNVLKGKFSFKVGFQEKWASALTEDLLGDSGAVDSLALNLKSDALNSVFQGVVNPLSLMVWGGIYNNTSYHGRDAVLYFGYSDNDSYASNNRTIGTEFGDFEYDSRFGNWNNPFEEWDTMLKEGTKTFTTFLGTP